MPDSLVISRLAKISTIVSFILLAYSLEAINAQPTKGYELSIYHSIPTIFWFSIIYSFVNSIAILMLNIQGAISDLWKVSILQIILTKFFLLSLYALHGYQLYLGRGDTATYVGMALDITNNGCISNNFYPFISILISCLSQLTAISAKNISNYLSPVFFALYTISIYCWSKHIIADRRFVLASQLAAMPLFFAWFSTVIYHQLLAVLSMPLFFYILKNNNNISFRILSIVMLLIYPFWHPITAIFILFYIILWYLYDEYINKNQEQETTHPHRKMTLMLVMTGFVSLFAWFIQQYAVIKNLKIIIIQILGLISGSSSFEDAQIYANKLGFIDASKSFLLMFSDELIYYGLSIISIYYILKYNNKRDRAFLPLGIILFAGSILLTFIFIFSKSHTPYRLINLDFNIIFAVPLVGYCLYFSIINKKNVLSFFVAISILLSLIATIFTVYPSPMVLYPNDQVSTFDIRGSDWIISHRNPEFGNAYLQTPIIRFSDLIYGVNFSSNNKDLGSKIQMPHHFEFSSIKSDGYKKFKEIYLVISEFDIQSYMVLWKDLDMFQDNDLLKLDYPFNAKKIYENGEFRAYLFNQDRI